MDRFLSSALSRARKRFADLSVGRVSSQRASRTHEWQPEVGRPCLDRDALEGVPPIRDRVLLDVPYLVSPWPECMSEEKEQPGLLMLLARDAVLRLARPSHLPQTSDPSSPHRSKRR